MKFKYILFFSLLLCKVQFAQNIINTLGSTGSFTIKDGSTTYLSLSQSNGQLTLSRSLILPVMNAGSQVGVIYRGSDRFIHNYWPGGTTGNNTFIGISSGNFSLSGIGVQASNNTAVGYLTLNALTTGRENSSFGSLSLSANTSGSYNCALGYLSLSANTSGQFNSAFGTYSLSNNISGNNNSAFGRDVLYNNSIGQNNSAFGYSSMTNNTTGNSNCAFGGESLYSGTTGSFNAVFGTFAGALITTGSNNIAIGYNTQVPNGTTNNQVRIGNANITYAGIQVGWTITSDLRLKSNIQSTPLGLEFISKLRPVSYTRINDEDQNTEQGFIAQEVDELLRRYEMTNTGMVSVDDEGTYSLRYNDFIAPLVKAVQELKIENDALRTEIESLKRTEERVKKLEKILLKQTELSGK